MELWRADMCMSVVDLDASGVILPPEHAELGALYPPSLLLGCGFNRMVDRHISTVLRVRGEGQGASTTRTCANAAREGRRSLGELSGI